MLILEKKHINQKARPKLAKFLDSATCYLLDGKLPRNKKEDFAVLLLWAETDNGKRYFIQDDSAADCYPESFIKIELNDHAFESLQKKIAETLPKPPKAGRPPKYGDAEQWRARQLKAAGRSIRDIAKEMGASTYTIQKLLK